MTEVKIDWLEVNNIPLSYKYIQSLGERFGESRYIINIQKTFDRFTGNFDKEKKAIYELTTENKIKLLEISKANHWIGIIGSNFAHDYKDYIVTKICKLNID